MDRLLARFAMKWRTGLVVMLTSLAVMATMSGLAQPSYAAPPSAPIIVPEDVVAPLTDQQIVALATQVQKTLTPEERKEVKRILAEVEKEKAEKAHKGEITPTALPALATYAVYLIVRFGIPWVIKYASNVFTSVFLNQSMKFAVCAELRNRGNGWGWSWYCRGTF